MCLLGSYILQKSWCTACISSSFIALHCTWHSYFWPSHPFMQTWSPCEVSFDCCCSLSRQTPAVNRAWRYCSFNQPVLIIFQPGAFNMEGGITCGHRVAQLISPSNHDVSWGEGDLKEEWSRKVYRGGALCWTFWSHASTVYIGTGLLILHWFKVARQVIILAFNWLRSVEIVMGWKICSEKHSSSSIFCRQVICSYSASCTLTSWGGSGISKFIADH